jgi:hypothetical protein
VTPIHPARRQQASLSTPNCTSHDAPATITAQNLNPQLAPSRAESRAAPAKPPPAAATTITNGACAVTAAAPTSAAPALQGNAKQQQAAHSSVINKAATAQAAVLTAAQLWAAEREAEATAARLEVGREREKRRAEARRKFSAKCAEHWAKVETQRLGQLAAAVAAGRCGVLKCGKKAATGQGARHGPSILSNTACQEEIDEWKASFQALHARWLRLYTPLLARTCVCSNALPYCQCSALYAASPSNVTSVALVIKTCTIPSHPAPPRIFSLNCYTGVMRQRLRRVWMSSPPPLNSPRYTKPSRTLNCGVPPLPPPTCCPHI